MKKEKELTKHEMIQEFWKRGELGFLLKGKQIEIYDYLRGTTDPLSVVCCSRRFGKSYILCTLATETCLKIPEAIVKYAAPTKTMVKDIIKKIMRTLLKTCPQHLMPEWKEADKRYVFQNGSEIHVAATEGGNIEHLVGGSCHLYIIDEASRVSELTYAINSVLAPTTDTVHGKGILASTPNFRQPNHEFHTEYIIPRMASGTLKKYTIYDSPTITKEKLAQIIARYGGEDSPYFRTEYLCELQFDDDKIVLGELTPERELEIVKHVELPPYYDAYVSMDIGVGDLTALLFAYYDFLNNRTVIVDELFLRGNDMATDNLATQLKAKELKNFVSDKTGFPIEPYMRVADNNNPILLNDLRRIHNITFLKTAKDNKFAQINELKLRIKRGQVIISPNCKNLLYHLRGATWNKHKDGFERMKDQKAVGLVGGHADFLDALIYLIRNVSLSRNPFPDGYFAPGSNTFLGRNYVDKLKNSSGWKGISSKLFGQGFRNNN